MKTFSAILRLKTPRKIFRRRRLKECFWFGLILLGFSFLMTFYRIYLYNLSLGYETCWKSTLMEKHNIEKSYHVDQLKSKDLFPRVVGYFPKQPIQGNQNYSKKLRVQCKFTVLDPNVQTYPSKRSLSPVGNRKAQMAIINDDDYYTYSVYDPDLNDSCQLKFDWQKKSLPNCNIIHEFDLASSFLSKNSGDKTKLNNRISLIGEGYWRSVFLFKEDELTVCSKKSKNSIFKSIRFKHEFSPRNLDRMRRDALIMERLTSSRYIIDIYAYCGTSTFSEYGEGKDIAAAIWPKSGSVNLSSIDKLRIGTYVFNEFLSLLYFDTIR
jgi:hypothetical protein